MRRLLIVLVAGFASVVVAVPSLSWAQDTQFEAVPPPPPPPPEPRESLRGLPGVFVYVEDPRGPYFEQNPPVQAVDVAIDIQRDVELLLQLKDIPVLTQEEAFDTPAAAALVATVMTSSKVEEFYAVSIELYLNQSVTLANGSVTRGQTYGRSRSVVLVGGDALVEEVRGRVSLLLLEFVEDWLVVNPR